MEILDLIQSIEGWIRAGDIASASKAIHKLSYKGIARRHRQKLANLAWRSGAEVQAAKILHPVVASEEAVFRNDATPEESIEYAAVLQKLGSLEEAINILAAQDPERHPQADLYLAFCYFSRWQYQQAISPLERYINNPGITGYARTVGKVNLLATNVSLGRLDFALYLSKELSAELRDSKNYKLLGNVKELTAQIYLQKADWKQAETYLNAAAEMFNKEKISDHLFVRKWQAVIASMRSKNIEAIEKFKKVAVSRGHWESVRESDLFYLKCKFDDRRFKKLIYGTPHPEYHQRVSRILEVELPSEPTCLLGEDSLNRLDMSYGTFNGSQTLKPGKNIHRLIYFLCCDLYKPQSIGSVHGSVFPDERFNIMSTPNKIHQLVNRSKTELKKHKIPLSIEETFGRYYLQGVESIGLCLDMDKVLPSQDLVNWRLLTNNSDNDELSRKSIMAILNLPLTNTNRFIKWCLENEKLEKYGTGKNTRYRLVQESTLNRVA